MPRTSRLGSEESLTERLTRQFYQWEMRGRGWDVWEQPVDLEPQFYPFFGHYDPEEAERLYDDARKPTFFSELADRIVELWKGRLDSSGELPSALEGEEAAYQPIWFEDDGDLVEFQVALPPESKVAKDAVEQVLLGIGHVSRPIAFEIIGTHDSIVVQFTCAQSDAPRVRGQIKAYFHEAVLTEHNSFLTDLSKRSGTEGAVVDFGLSNEFMRPIRCFGRFDPDPLAGIIEAMAELADGESALFQILFSPVVNPWQESILRAVTDGRGGSFFADDPTIVQLAGQKVSCPLFGAVVRIAAQSETKYRAWQIVEGIGASLRQFSDPQSNEFIPLTNDGYDDWQHLEDLRRRQSRRSGMLLNSDELLSLVHLPSSSVHSMKLKREERKSKAAPALSLGNSLCLGENDHGGRSGRVTQSPEQRVRHTYVIGASGTGKSTLLLNMIVQDIEKGEGLAVLDPHGDLIDDVFVRIPEKRVNDVVLLDPSDEEFPVGFNILSAHSDLERNLLASDLVSVFKRLSTSWGDQMTVVLANAILAFLESSEGGTLSDLRRFLVEPDFRRRFLDTVRDPEVLYYWQCQGRMKNPVFAG